MTLGSYRGRVALSLGVRVAAAGGAFELRIVRPDYVSRPRGAQVDPATGEALRLVPPENVAGWNGLRRFFRVTVRTPQGAEVAVRHLPFCPNTYDRERVADAGPILPRYPSACRSESPFLRGMVWGVDEGWSVSAFGGFEGRRAATVPLEPGTYTADVEIAPFFRSLFGVPEEHASASLALTVKAGGAWPRAGRTVAAAAVPAPAGVPDLEDPDPETVPDLAALPAWNLYLVRRGRREYLTFTSSPWNAGPAPLVVEGFRRPGTGTMDAFQYFYDESGEAVGRARVGVFRWDARRGHLHWHFTQFVRYAIVDAKTNAVVRSYKQSFCLAPTDTIDLTVPRAVYIPWTTGLASVCGQRTSKWVREALPAGWADTYHQTVAGQAFNVTRLPNGRYRVLVELNPKGLLHERTTANNRALRTFVLRGRPGKRRVVVAPWYGITR